MPALRPTAKKPQGQEKSKRGYQKALPFLGQAYNVRHKGKLSCNHKEAYALLGGARKAGIEHAFALEFDYDFEPANLHFCLKYMN